MRYDETGFRGVYQNFITLPLTAFKGRLDNYPGIDKADCVLCYGFIKNDEGVCLLALGCGRHIDNGVEFFEGSRETVDISVKKIRQYDFMIVKEKDLRERYHAQLEMLRKYEASAEVMESRTFQFLDEIRDPYQIDDVQVLLFKKGVDTEMVIVRITGLQQPYIIGQLLEEPIGEFGCHKGDVIGFYVREDGYGGILLTADLNPSERVAKKDVISYLRKGIEAFNKAPDEKNYVEVLSLLKDCELYVPYLELNHQNVETLMKKDDKDIISHQIPDILQNNTGRYLPAFTSELELGAYGSNFIIRKVSFTDIIKAAESSSARPDGILINPYGHDPFVVKKELYKVMESLESRLK